MDVRSIILKQQRKLTPQYREIKRLYRLELNHLRVTRSQETKIAIVIHLYYPETWQFFKKHLQILESQNFDLFVSLQEKDRDFAKEIAKTHPRAYIFVAPNRGRDILPFTKIVKEVIRPAGYEIILKLHSKKSPHRKDGGDWLQGMVKSLLPIDHKVLEKLLTTLADSKTGIVGPVGQYLSLAVNFEANGVKMTQILKRLYGATTANRVLQIERTAHGFFAGSMFWARVDAFDTLLNASLDVADFDPEEGQIDATFAHAYERVFSLVAEVEARSLYEIGPEGVRQIQYAQGAIPDWSNIYVAPR